MTTTQAQVKSKKCSTVGCKHDATHVLTYSFRESRDVTETDQVCLRCGSGYVNRPSLKAKLVPLAVAASAKRLGIR